MTPMFVGIDTTLSIPFPSRLNDVQMASRENVTPLVKTVFKYYYIKSSLIWVFILLFAIFSPVSVKDWQFYDGVLTVKHFLLMLNEGDFGLARMCWYTLKPDLEKEKRCMLYKCLCRSRATRCLWSLNVTIRTPALR